MQLHGCRLHRALSSALPSSARPGSTSAPSAGASSYPCQCLQELLHCENTALNSGLCRVLLCGQEHHCRWEERLQQLGHHRPLPRTRRTFLYCKSSTLLGRQPTSDQAADPGLHHLVLPLQLCHQQRSLIGGLFLYLRVLGNIRHFVTRTHTTTQPLTCFSLNTLLRRKSLCLPSLSK